jgi:ribosome-associated translation inhibitor RaiA
MQQPVGDSKLTVRFDTHEFHLADAEKAKMLDNLASLGRQVAGFPVADLNLSLGYNGHSRDYSVKMSLRLPGTTLVSWDHDVQLHPAFERALAALRDNVRGYKDQLERMPDRQREEKGTVHRVQQDGSLDVERMTAAVQAGDYAAFRVTALPYEESVRKRAGRWVERYPQLAAQVGRTLQINDLVEGVFLAAFEGFTRRPADVRFGDWLDGLFDPVLKALQQHRDEELENINLARSAVEAQGGPGLV